MIKTSLSFIQKRVISTLPKTETEALNLIKKTVEENPVVLFMKGTPDRPQCGFSRTVVQVINQFHVNNFFLNTLS